MVYPANGMPVCPALVEGRKITASYYYRSAKFFMFSHNPQKQKCRNKFLELIREHYNISEKDINYVP